MLHALFAGLYVVMIAKLSFGESLVTIREAAAGAAAGARQARFEASRVRERGGRRRHAGRPPAAPEPAPGPAPGPGERPAMPSRHWWARVRDAAAAGAAAARAHRPSRPRWRLRVYRRTRAATDPPVMDPGQTQLPGDREGYAEGEFADGSQPFVSPAARPGPGTVDAELVGPPPLPPPARTELPGERLTALPVPGREPFTTPVAVQGSPQRMPVTGPATPAIEAPAAFTLPAAVLGPQPGAAAAVTSVGCPARWPLPAATARHASPPPIPAPATGGTAMTGASRRYALPAAPGVALAARTPGQPLPAAGANHGHFEQLTARIREEVGSQAGCIATLTGWLADADAGDFHLTAMRAWLDRYIAMRQAILAAEDEIGRTVGQYVTAVDSIPGGPRNSASPAYLDRF
jgi:hypothetical protein